MVGVVVFGVWLIVAFGVAYQVGKEHDDPVWAYNPLGSLLTVAALWPLLVAYAAGMKLARRRSEKEKTHGAS